MEDLGWLCLNQPPVAVVKDTSDLVGQDNGTGKAGAEVHCVLGRESSNLIGLDGAAKGSTDIQCVLGRE